jgi:hypothetical protein
MKVADELGFSFLPVVVPRPPTDPPPQPPPRNVLRDIICRILPFLCAGSQDVQMVPGEMARHEGRDVVDLIIDAIYEDIAKNRS